EVQHGPVRLDDHRLDAAPLPEEGGEPPTPRDEGPVYLIERLPPRGRQLPQPPQKETAGQFLVPLDPPGEEIAEGGRPKRRGVRGRFRLWSRKCRPTASTTPSTPRSEGGRSTEPSSTSSRRS